MSSPSESVRHTAAIVLRTGEAPTASPEDFVGRFDTSTVPIEPGCYIMEDAKGKPSTGKAKSLRARIRTYINASDSRYSVSS